MKRKIVIKSLNRIQYVIVIKAHSRRPKCFSQHGERQEYHKLNSAKQISSHDDESNASSIRSRNVEK
jgi:hypothetical protein